MAERTHSNGFASGLPHPALSSRRNPAPIRPGAKRTRTNPLQGGPDGLDEVRGWSRDAGGNTRHQSGQFFGV